VCSRECQNKIFSEVGRTKTQQEAGLNLKAIREQHGLDGTQLSKLMGCKDETYICRLERGKRRISKDMAIKLADFFKVDYTMFF